MSENLLHWLEHAVFLHGIVGERAQHFKQERLSASLLNKESRRVTGIKNTELPGVTSCHLVKAGTSSVVLFFTCLVCQNILVIFIFWKLNFSINLSSNTSRKAEPWRLGFSSFSQPTRHAEGKQSNAEVKWCACALDRQKAFSLIRCQTVSFESVVKASSCLVYAN